MKGVVSLLLCFLVVSSFAVETPFEPKDEDLISQKIMKMPAAKILVGIV